MEPDLPAPQEAIGVYKNIRADDGVRYAHEPAGAEDLWLPLMTVPSAKGSVWSDAWLAAFGLSPRSKLAYFVAGMRPWATLEREVLGR